MQDDVALSSLGDRLLAAVRNLWRAVNSNSAEISQIQARVAALESDLRSLKISRGKAKAKNIRLEAALSEAETKISDIRRRLN